MKFELDDDQKAKLEVWLSNIKRVPRRRGSIGGRFTYKFTETDVGTVVEVIDNITKQEIDLTDYESW